MYTKYCKRFGSANGPDSFLKAVEEITKINEKANEKIASIRQLECGTVIVAVCDEVMKRTHVLVPQAGDVMYVVATGSLDRCNHQVYYHTIPYHTIPYHTVRLGIERDGPIQI